MEQKRRRSSDREIIGKFARFPSRQDKTVGQRWSLEERSRLIEQEWQKYLAHEEAIKRQVIQRELVYRESVVVKSRPPEVIARELLECEDFDRAVDLVEELGRWTIVC